MAMKIIKFSTPDCTWCRVVDPHVKNYAKAHELEVVEIDAEADEETAKRYGIMGVPVVVFEDIETGAEMARAKGFPEIMSLISE